MLARLRSRCYLSLVLLGVWLFATQSDARTPRVLLGEVRTLGSVAPARAHVFRELVQRTFATMQIAEGVGGPSYVLSTTLLELSTVEREHSHTKTCVVSLVLRDRKAGTLKAALSGEARLLESERPTREGDQIVMQTAVRRALFRLRDFLK